MASSTRIRKQAKRYKGQKVYVTLHNGRTYVGWISGLGKEALILSTTPVRPKRRKSSPVRSRKAGVSAFMPLLGSFLGGSGAGAAGLGGLGALGSGLRFLGVIQRAMPVMKMGYGIIKQIRPFMTGLQGLMGPGTSGGQGAADEEQQ